MISKYWKAFFILFLIILYLIYKIYLDNTKETFLVGNVFISPGRVNSVDNHNHFERGGVNPLYDPYKDNIDELDDDKIDCCDPGKQPFDSLPKIIKKLENIKKYIKNDASDHQSDKQIIDHIIDKYKHKNQHKDDYDSSKGCSDLDYIDSVIVDHLTSKHRDGLHGYYDLESDHILEYLQKYNQTYNSLSDTKEQLFNEPVDMESTGIHRYEETCVHKRHHDRHNPDLNPHHDHNNNNKDCPDGRNQTGQAQMAAVGRYGIYKGMSPSLPFCSQSDICKSLNQGTAMAMASDKIANNCGKCFKLSCIKDPQNWSGSKCSGSDVILKVVDKIDNTPSHNSNSSYPHMFNLDTQQYDIIAGTSNCTGLIPIHYTEVPCPF